MGQRRIGDYAAIGDGRSVALVSRDGAVDWLCWPKFDSPSVFGALLDPDGGTFQVSPAAAFECTRSYVDDTNVLQMRFRTAGGTAVLTDALVAPAEAELSRGLWPEQALVRQLRCEQGALSFELHFNPRPGYGRAKARVEDAGHFGRRVHTRQGLITLQSEPVLRWKDGRAVFELKAGEEASFVLSYSSEAPGVFPPPAHYARLAIDATGRFWKDWSGRCTYRGPHRDEVVRSALALRLLLFAPSGAVVAAPTTSLPEQPGGSWNWDYRFCWLRDSALTIRALLTLGYRDEAETFVDWLLHSTRLTRPELAPLYDLYGRPPGPERELSHWRGYRGARPVRVGNAAVEQLQLDTYGEVIDAFTQLARIDKKLDFDTRRMLRSLARFICENWRRPDKGIWEPRTPDQHFTHSRVLCWAALDRLTELHFLGVLPRLDCETVMRNRAEIHDDVTRHAWNEELQSYTQILGGDTVDASLLLMSWYGFEPARTPRMQKTAKLIRERLCPRPGLLYRYEESPKIGEGAFGACNFWWVEFLARGGGTLDEAERAFHDAIAWANDVGLYAEEMHPGTGDALGNFPQAFTHVGLITAAASIEERRAEEQGRPVPPVWRPSHHRKEHR